MNTPPHAETTVSRRRFLAATAATALAGTLAARRTAADTNATGLVGRWAMKPRPDLLEEKSRKGIEVFQLTTEQDVPASHIYMEANQRCAVPVFSLKTVPHTFNSSWEQPISTPNFAPYSTS